MSDFTKIIAILTAIGCYSCVSPYDIRFHDAMQVLVVDAILTDEDAEQQIQILASDYFNGIIHEIPLSNLKAEILVNHTTKIKLTERGDGVYALPITFRTKIGDTYQLLFQKADGTQYQSTEERLISAPKIDKIYDEFVAEGLLQNNKRLPVNNVYIDFKDSASQQNYYKWSWNLWERQYICTTTDYYDLYCDKDCWDILHDNKLDIFSDEFSNGKSTVGKLVAQIPYYQFNGALLEIRQQTISAEAYHFLKQLQDQVQNSGTLVDTPPAAVVGNIKNITNPNEEIAGVFMVTSVVSEKYWLSRENASGKARPIGLLLRSPNVSPVSIRSPCIESKNRTAHKPKEWRD